MTTHQITPAARAAAARRVDPAVLAVQALDAINTFDDVQRAYMAVEILTVPNTMDSCAASLRDLDRNQLSALLRALNANFEQRLRDAKSSIGYAVD